MNRDDVIRMAREAGFMSVFMSPMEQVKALERFAVLVAAHEREACAKVCEDKVTEHGIHSNFICAKAIRARGEA